MKIYLAISSKRHKFSPMLVQSGQVSTHRGTVDLGYLELAELDGRAMERMLSIFSSEKRLALGVPRELDQWVIIVGYPGEGTENTSSYVKLRIMIALTLVATDKEILPKSVGRVPDGFQSLALLYPRENIVSPEPGVFEHASAISFNGMSGGGCWLPDLTIVELGRRAPLLCAIHTGTVVAVVIDDREFVFLRQVPLIYHLRMIADAYPDLASDMKSRWPELVKITPASAFK